MLLQFVLVEGDEVESVPVAVGFVRECGLGEETRLILILAFHIEALRVRVVSIFRFYPRSLDDASALVHALIHVVDFVALAVRDCDFGPIRESDVVPLGVWGAGESLADEVLVKKCFA